MTNSVNSVCGGLPLVPLVNSLSKNPLNPNSIIPLETQSHSIQNELNDLNAPTPLSADVPPLTLDLEKLSLISNTAQQVLLTPPHNPPLSPSIHLTPSPKQPSQTEGNIEEKPSYAISSKFGLIVRRNPIVKHTSPRFNQSGNWEKNTISYSPSPSNTPTPRSPKSPKEEDLHEIACYEKIGFEWTQKDRILPIKPPNPSQSRYESGISKRLKLQSTPASPSSQEQKNT